jgi:hypothetical protein
LALFGPIKIRGGDFVQTITDPIRFDFSIKDTLSSIGSGKGLFESGPLADLLSTAGVKALIGNSSISVQVNSDNIATTAGLALPVFLPIPRKISFPYATTLSIYGGKVAYQKAVQVDVTSVTIVRTDTAIIANTSILVLPTNTDAAATALAESVNPVLRANPVASSIGLKDFAFYSSGRKPFQWCSDLFAAQIINFGLPPICKKCLLESSVGQVATSLPVTQLVTVRTLDAAQMDDMPGFSAKGTVDVSYPAHLPALSIDIGFFNMAATVEATELMSIQLPTGIKFMPQNQGTNIDARAVLSRNAQLASKIQRLANALLLDEALPSFAGVTGLSFGASGTNKIVTFSKIAVDVNTTDIKDMLAGSGSDSSSLSSFIKPGMVKLAGADFALDNPTDATLALSTQVANPIPNFTFSMGTLSLSTILQDQSLVSITIQPINLHSGTAPLDISIGLKIATGANGMDVNVARLVDGVLVKDTALQMLLGVTSLKISPKGNSQAGLIDQLEPIKLQLHAGKVIDLLNSQSTAPSALDTSGIMPGDNILDQLSPKVQFVLLDTPPGGLLRVGADVGYTNPLPLSAKLPYIGLIARIDGADVVEIEIMGVELVRAEGNSI